MQRHLHLKMRTKLTKTRCIVIRQFLHAKMAKFKQLLINLRISIRLKDYGPCDFVTFTLRFLL